MSSPARRHFERVTAEQAAASAAADGRPSMEGATIYDLMLLKLNTDRRRLKSVQSVERKVEVKREVLPEYSDYVDGVLAGGRGAQDEVLTTLMMWRVDVGDIAGALPIAAYALEHNMAMPDAYERTLATAFAEEVADQALSLFNTEPVDVELLQAVAHLTAPHDMFDQVRAKLHKAIGYALQDDPAAALPYLQRAVQLHEHVGVKKDIARLERELGMGQKEATDTAAPEVKQDTTRQATPPGAEKPAKPSGPGRQVNKPKNRK